MRRISRKAIFKEFVRWMQRRCRLEISTAKRYAQIISKICNNQPLSFSDKLMKSSATRYWNAFKVHLEREDLFQYEELCPICESSIDLTTEDSNIGKELKKVVRSCSRCCYAEVYYFRSWRCKDEKA